MNLEEARRIADKQSNHHNLSTLSEAVLQLADEVERLQNELLTCEYALKEWTDEAVRLREHYHVTESEHGVWCAQCGTMEIDPTDPNLWPGPPTLLEDT